MGFSEAIKTVFSKYATITGRASRSEYWYFQLFYTLVYVGVMVVSTVIPFLAILVLVFAVAMFIPTITVSIRRLHDKNRSGWWLLLSFIPLIGILVLLFWFVTAGTDGPNAFGADPLAHPEDV